MPDRADITIQEKLNQRLRFYEDIGLGPFYRDRRTSVVAETPSISIEEPILPKSAAKSAVPPPAAKLPGPSAAPVVPSLFEATSKIAGDTLPLIRTDLADCTRCKLHTTRNKIDFGDGSAKSELVFIGEGPGADKN